MSHKQPHFGASPLVTTAQRHMAGMIWRAILFALMLFITADPAKANQAQALLNACPALQASSDAEPDAAEIARAAVARRYELGRECIIQAMPWMIAARGATLDDEVIQFYALALIRTVHEAELCTPPENQDMSITGWMTHTMLQMARDALNLREQSNRHRYADALRLVLRDPRAFAYAPPSCANGASPSSIDAAHIAEVETLIGAIVQALPDERSIGLFTVWTDLPMLDAQIGFETSVSNDLPGLDVQRAWLLRRDGTARAVLRGEGSGHEPLARTNVYVTHDRQIGLISRGHSQALSLDGNAIAAANEDSWQYVGAFEIRDVRWSGSGRRRTPVFAPASESPECVVALPETSFRERARAANCEPAVIDSAEYAYSVALHVLFEDWWNRTLEHAINMGQLTADVDRRRPPMQPGVTNSVEFFVSTRPSPGETDLAVVVKVIDTEVETDLSVSAQRFAAAGADEYWAIDPRTRRTIVFSAVRDGQYTRRRVVRANQTLEPPSLAPQLTLRLDQLDLTAAERIDFAASS